MLKIIAKFVVKEDKVDEFKECCKSFIFETRKEEGCISYELFQDKNDKKVLIFVEEWKNEEAVVNHNNTAHIKNVLPTLISLVEEEPVLNITEIVC